MADFTEFKFICECGEKIDGLIGGDFGNSETLYSTCGKTFVVSEVKERVEKESN